MKGTFVRNILGDKYQVLSGWKTVNLINDCLKQKNCWLTTEQERVLKDSFGDCGIHGNLEMPFLAFAWEEEKTQGKNMWWRLTTPFLLVWIYLILVPIVLPIKWLLTGKYYFERETKLGILTQNWYNKTIGRKSLN
ncbi:MAG: hypothetical protein J6X18_06900 [Bacteroidales bacterium]|nr:hypothetical protein [Bacteroidales bacterium]